MPASDFKRRLAPVSDWHACPYEEIRTYVLARWTNAPITHATLLIIPLIPVLRVLRARVVHPDDDEDVLELRLEVGDEGERARLLEDDGDDVVADVALPRQLLPVVGREREQGGHVEHDLVSAGVRVHRVEASRVVLVAKAGLGKQEEIALLRRMYCLWMLNTMEKESTYMAFYITYGFVAGKNQAIGLT